MIIETNNIKWWYMDEMPCIGFYDGGLILPDKDLHLAVIVTNNQFCFGNIEKISDDKFIFYSGGI